MESEFRQYAREAFRQMDDAANHATTGQLAEYLRGEMSEAALPAFERHLAACAPCARRADELREFLGDAGRPAPRNLDREFDAVRRRIRRQSRSAFPRWGAVAAGMALAAGASWYAWRELRPDPARLLALAYQEQRTSEFRLAAAPYAPVRLERAAGSTFSRPASLLKAQALLAERIQTAPDDPTILRLQGEAEMIARDAASAVRTLQRARDLRPQDPRILADLGAAYALRGDSERQFGDYLTALDYLTRARRAQPNAADIAFNRALTLEKAMLPDQAMEEWNAYLKLDSSSGWAAEARRHLAELQQKIKAREERLREVDGDPSHFLARITAAQEIDAEAYLRDYAVTQWLPRAAADDTARQAAGALARILADRHGDRWLTDILAVPAPAAALEQLAAARAANQKTDLAAAVPSARRARDLFQRGGNRAGALWARFEEVVGLHYSLQTEACLSAAESLGRDLQHERYIWLRAQTDIEHAVCAMRAGKLDEAAPHLLEARALAQTARFGEAALRAAGIHLDVLVLTATPSDLFAAAGEALRIYWSGAYPAARTYQVLNKLRITAHDAGLLHASFVYAGSTVAAAPNPIAEAMAWANRAAAAQAIGDREEANRAIRAGSDLLRRMPPRADSAYQWDPQILLATVELDGGNPDAALARLEPLRNKFQPPPTALMGTRFFWALGEASRQKANWTAAADSFRQSIAIGSPGVRSLATPEAGLVRLVEESYRGLVAATLAAPGAENAAYDTWRAYQSLDNSGAPARSSAPLLSFVELPDGLVAWLGQDGGSSFHRIAATRDEFAAVANRFLRECSDPAVPSGQLRADARRLYDWMIAPFADRLPAGRVLAVALDRGFGAIPVQALLAPDGRYLAERDPILVFTGYGEQPATPARDAAALIVANPAVAGASAARFPPLPDSTAEANAVRAAFPASRVLEGSGATLDALARALPEASIVHFAGHGYTGSENGAILLAPRDPAAADYDLLRFSELRRLPWSQCRLAVLSACATAAGETRGPHNPESLVRALIKGGAARVAASLWNVDSAATSALMQQFYSALASGADVPAAMRIAQDAVRRRPEWAHPYYWAGFQLYGKT